MTVSFLLVVVVVVIVIFLALVVVIVTAVGNFLDLLDAGRQISLCSFFFGLHFSLSSARDETSGGENGLFGITALPLRRGFFDGEESCGTVDPVVSWGLVVEVRFNSSSLLSL